MRSEETLLKAKEQFEEIQEIKDEFEEWEEWEASEEQCAYEEEHGYDDDFEWPVDEDEICHDVYELSTKMLEILDVFINNEKTGGHQAKRNFKDCIGDIRSIRRSVNKAVEDKEKYLELLTKLENICRVYM